MKLEENDAGKDWADAVDRPAQVGEESIAPNIGLAEYDDAANTRIRKYISWHKMKTVTDTRLRKLDS